MASGKTSSFGLAKEIGEVEVGFNCYVRKRTEKRSESYFDDDFSNFFSSFGVSEDRNAPKRMSNYNSRFNSMPALMQIIWKLNSKDQSDQKYSLSSHTLQCQECYSSIEILILVIVSD